MSYNNKGQTLVSLRMKNETEDKASCDGRDLRAYQPGLTSYRVKYAGY